MTFAVKRRGASSQPIESEYECPEHGVFSCRVVRDENGDPPEAVACPELIEAVLDGTAEPLKVECELRSTWIASLVFGRVKKWEVVRGKWEKPARKTYLDTRELGEGQPLEEFREKRRKIWEARRQQEIKEWTR